MQQTFYDAPTRQNLAGDSDPTETAEAEEKERRAVKPGERLRMKRESPGGETGGRETEVLPVNSGFYLLTRLNIQTSSHP